MMPKQTAVLLVAMTLLIEPAHSHPRVRQLSAVNPNIVLNYADGSGLKCGNTEMPSEITVQGPFPGTEDVSSAWGFRLGTIVYRLHADAVQAARHVPPSPQGFDLERTLEIVSGSVSSAINSNLPHQQGGCDSENYPQSISVSTSGNATITVTVHQYVANRVCTDTLFWGRKAICTADANAVVTRSLSLAPVQSYEDCRNRDREATLFVAQPSGGSQQGSATARCLGVNVNTIGLLGLVTGDVTRRTCRGHWFVTSYDKS